MMGVRGLGLHGLGIASESPASEAEPPPDGFEAEVRKMSLRDGDCIVMTVPKSFGPAGRDRVNCYLTDLIRRLGVKAEPVVLEEGMTIEIIRTSDLPTAA